MLAPIYAFQGEDQIRLEEEATKIIQQANISEFNLIRYDGSMTDLNDILNEVSTISMLEEQKIVVVTHPSFLYEEYKNKEELEKMIAYFEHPNELTILILLIDGKLDGKSVITKALKKATIIQTVARLEGDGLKEWIKVRTQAQNKVIDSAAVDLLIDYCDKDSLRIQQEIEKLLLYKADESNITIQDVKMIVTKGLEEDIYQLLNAFLAKNTQKIMSLYQEFRSRNEDETRLINMISNKAEEMYYTKVLLKQSQANKEIAKDQVANYFHVSSGRAYFMVKNAQEIREQDLLLLMHRVSALDLNIKSGKIDKKVGFELFLLGL